MAAVVFLYKAAFFVAVSQNEHYIYFPENPWRRFLPPPSGELMRELCFGRENRHFRGFCRKYLTAVLFLSTLEAFCSEKLDAERGAFSTRKIDFRSSEFFFGCGWVRSFSFGFSLVFYSGDCVMKSGFSPLVIGLMFIITVMVVAHGGVAFCQVPVITLDYPGGVNTEADNVNGDLVVGKYDDPNRQLTAYGYVYNLSTSTYVTTFGDPSAGIGTGTFPHGISGNNIVGSYYDSANTWLRLQPFDIRLHNPGRSIRSKR